MLKVYNPIAPKVYSKNYYYEYITNEELVSHKLKSVKK